MPVADPLLGARVADRYRVEERIGEGGTGVVYRASRSVVTRHATHARGASDALSEDLVVDRPVAVKVLSREGLAGPGLLTLERFNREVRALASVQHPGVVAFLDSGTLDDGRLFLVMEHVAGRSLREVLDAGPMEPRRVQALGCQLLGALTAVHATGMTHRDLKPDNVRVLHAGAPDEMVKLIDFGIAKFIARGGPGTAIDSQDFAERGAVSVVGTPRYMAPEQFLGEPATARTDLYAVGLLLWEMLAGRPLVSAGTMSAAAARHLRGRHPAPRRGERDLEGPLVDFVLLCLARAPESRPPSARAALRLLRTREVGPTPAEGPPVEREPIGVQPLPAASPPPRGIRRLPRWVLAATAAAATVASAVWLLV